MAKKYTAADFANAQFAEHPDGRIAMKSSGGARWDVKFLDGHISTRDDCHMASFAWVPVPTKPTLAESEVKKMIGNYEVDEFAAGFAGGFRYAGGEITPDPEPTNTEKLDADIQAVDQHLTSRQLAEALIELGWKKDN